MTKVNVKFDEAAFARDLKAAFEKVKRSNQLLTEVGNIYSKAIIGQTKLGKPYNRTRSFPPLSSLTIQQRKYLQQFNSTDKSYKPGKANVTFSGQFLNSISGKVNTAKGLVSIGPRGSRDPYRTKNGVLKRPPSNDMLADFLAKAGFIVFDVKTLENDAQLNKRIRVAVSKALRRALRVAKLLGT